MSATAFYIRPSSSSTSSADITALQTQVSALKTDVNGATAVNSNSTLVKRDTTGGFAASTAKLDAIESNGATLDIAAQNGTITVNVGKGTGVQAINMGNNGSGATTINLGGTGDSINVGTLAAPAGAMTLYPSGMALNGRIVNGNTYFPADLNLNAVAADAGYTSGFVSNSGRILLSGRCHNSVSGPKPSTSGIQSQVMQNNVNPVQTKLVFLTSSTFGGSPVIAESASIDNNGMFSCTSVTTSAVESAGTTLTIAGQNNTSVVDIGKGTGVQTINVGNNGTGATTINLGGAGDTVNISGTLNNVTTTNTQVMDKTLVLNSGGTAATAGTAGIYFEEAGSSDNSYVRVSSDRSTMEPKAPTGSLIGLNQSLLTTDNVTFGTVTSTGINLSGNVNYGGSKFLSSNVASNLTVERSAGDAITSATNITAIGNGALSAITTSSFNTAVGCNSLNQITTGFGGNTAMGFNSGISMIGSSIQNTMIGFEAASIGTGTYSFSTAVGSQALKRCTASGNSAFGCGALLFTTSGGENVGVGTNAGSKLTTGANNTFVGSNAGDRNLSITTGSNNTLIGALTESASTAQNNATAIGYGAKVDADNCIQLGNTSVTAVKTSGVITSAGLILPTTGGTAATLSHYEEYVHNTVFSSATFTSTLGVAS